jgi:hypothetical protein
VGSRLFKLGEGMKAKTKVGWGGARAGAGRKRGGKNAATIARLKAQEERMAAVEAAEEPKSAAELVPLAVAALKDVMLHSNSDGARVRAAKAALDFVDAQRAAGGKKAAAKDAAERRFAAGGKLAPPPPPGTKH